MLEATHHGLICIVGPAHFGQALVSTTLAGALATDRQAVMLGELAAQPSASGELADWLAKRPVSARRISGWERVSGTNRIKPPAGTHSVVLHLHHDANAQRMAWAVARSRAVVVVVGHALMARDLACIQIEALAKEPRLQGGDCQFGVLSVGMATGCLAQRRTARWAANQAQKFKSLAYLGNIDDDARYGTWHAAGTQLFDYGEEQRAPLLSQWKPLLTFSERGSVELDRRQG